MSLELAKYGKKIDEEFKRIDLYDQGTYDTAMDREQLQNALWQFFPSSAGTKEAELRTYLEEYIKYKKSFVEHLQFDPDLKNMSKL